MFAERAEPLPAPAAVFAGDHPHVTRQCFAVREPRRVAQEHVRRQRGDRPDAGMGHEQRRSSALRGGVLHPIIELIDLLIQVLIQRLQLTEAMSRMGR